MHSIDKKINGQKETEYIGSKTHICLVQSVYTTIKKEEMTKRQNEIHNGSFVSYYSSICLLLFFHLNVMAINVIRLGFFVIHFGAMKLQRFNALYKSQKHTHTHTSCIHHLCKMHQNGIYLTSALLHGYIFAHSIPCLVTHELPSFQNVKHR